MLASQKQTNDQTDESMHSSPKPPISVLTSTWNPRTKALTKSVALVREAMSCVSLHVWKKDKHVSHIHSVYQSEIQILAVKTYFDFNVPGFEVESDLKLQVLNNGSENLQPVILQRCVPVGRDGYFSHLIWSLKHMWSNNSHSVLEYVEKQQDFHLRYVVTGDLFFQQSTVSSTLSDNQMVYNILDAHAVSIWLITLKTHTSHYDCWYCHLQLWLHWVWSQLSRCLDCSYGSFNN